jgi:hypothetical protein
MSSFAGLLGRQRRLYRPGGFGHQSGSAGAYPHSGKKVLGSFAGRVLNKCPWGGVTRSKNAGRVRPGDSRSQTMAYWPVYCTRVSTNVGFGRRTASR